MKTLAALKYVWASPASALGAILALGALFLGASLCLNAGVLEVNLRPRRARFARWLGGLPFSAITFGHVVLASTEAAQENLRTHERAHVAQYERWGALFLIAYPAESGLQYLLGRCPYQDNRFEMAARRAADLPAAQPAASVRYFRPPP